ncbi:hypothetical protein GCM10010246_56670 [Streptomyces cuspidosporus]|uniref:Transposase n=1 Tax=Streptomyces cuspidosporus TaxID=66882 RepID=A0ABN3GRM2_9ACTN
MDETGISGLAKAKVVMQNGDVLLFHRWAKKNPSGCFWFWVEPKIELFEAGWHRVEQSLRRGPWQADPEIR